MQFPGVGNGFCNDPWLDYAEENIATGPYNMVDESSPALGNIYTINSYGGFYTDLSYISSETTEFIEPYTSLSHKSGVSAHDYQRKTLDYFWNHHGYSGIDGNGKRTISVVNYTNVAGGLDQRNAFYNAALDVLTYGLGGNGYRPFCAAQDIVTHEFTHGYTAHTSGLIYRNQAGAMNESMSDVFGYLVEAEYQDGGDWTQGEDVHYSGASRSFINPPQYNQPDHVDHPYFVEYNPNPQWSNDFGGVHYNSGITNKIMYLVIAGDTHYSIEVLPLEEDINASRQAAANIWFAWSSYYLDPEDDFEIGREKMLQACNDLYPDNFNYYQTIASGWASTGIGSEIVFIPGDLNQDQYINILDIVELVNIILNGSPDETQLYLGDLNSDGSINILDIIELVNLILG
jgi:Zn-dependent metalloprotease